MDVLASKLTQRHAQELLSLERGEIQALAKIYQEARREILGRLHDVGAETFTAQQLRVTLAQVEAGVAVMRRRLRERQETVLPRLLRAGARQTLEEIAFWEAARGFRGAAHSAIPLEVVRGINAELLLERYAKSLEAFGAQLVGDVQRRLGVHVVKRSAWREMANDLAGRFEAAVIPGARWRAERIVRTELVHALNAGHQAGLEAMAEELPGLRRQWDATLDERTSEGCRHLNGQVKGLHEPWVWKGREVAHPPLVPNCRSRVIPWRAAWLELERNAGAA
jgi:SPP1 gp7 family putative phage head morphogenesis protein